MKTHFRFIVLSFDENQFILLNGFITVTMPSRLLLVTTIALIRFYLAVAINGYQVKEIVDEIPQRIHTENRSRSLIQDETVASDVCDNGKRYPDYGDCDRRRFPLCAKDEIVCYFRMPRDDDFINGDSNDPSFFIDYHRVECVPIYGYNCNRCDPGKFCDSLGRCVLQWNRYCPDSPRYRYHKQKKNKKKTEKKAGYY